MQEVSKGRILKRADPSTIQDKFLVGYQGWFTCGGDGEPVGPGHHGWLHWFNYPVPDGGHPNIDLWPDVSEYSPSELFAAPGLKYKSGEQAFLFSSRHPKTVQRHFHWMAKHGVDGAFLQRFATEVDVDAGRHGIRRIRDEVGDRVREAAEKEGRVFAVMYDVTGLPAERIVPVIQRDWVHLIRNQGLLDSPNYLREKRKPVVALWGFGFENAGHTPAIIREVCNFLRYHTPGGVYIVGGVAAHWRSHSRDADRNPEFVDMYTNHFDAISPWTIGRYKDEEEADHFAEQVMKGDIEFLKKKNDNAEMSGEKKIDYIPVVFPGGSGFNMTEGKWAFNGIKRNGGKFLWKQISNARRQGVRIMYGAMWDEYDEGTALMPVIEKKRLLPQSDKFPFLALDEDGFDIPSDWYMRICGFAAEGLRSERRIHDSFPSKELQDYWATRPKYEDLDVKSGDFVSGAGSSGGSGGSGSGEGQSYQDWLEAQKEKEDGPPPPPYTLEAEEEPAAAPPTQNQSQQATPIIQPTSAIQHAATSLPSHRVSPPPHAIQSPSISHSSNLPSSPTAGAFQTAVYPANEASSQTPYQGHPAPPATNYSTYPVSGPTQSNTDPIASLTNDFNRHTISPPPIALGGPMANLPDSRPPLHPSHPSNAQPPPLPLQQRPSARPSRPSTASPPASNPTSPRPGVATFNQGDNTPGPWSQGQWPPPDWQVNRPAQTTPQHQTIQHQQPHSQSGPHPPQQPHSSYTDTTSYPNHGYANNVTPSIPGANLSRPSSYTAGRGHHHQAPLRPHASIGPGSIRPGSSQGHSHNQPQQSLPGAYPYPNSTPPSAPYPGPSTSTYPGQSTYNYSQAGSSYNPPPAGAPMFPGMPSTYGSPPGQSSGFGGPPLSTYPGQAAYPPTSPPLIGVPSSHDSNGQSSYAQPGMNGGPFFPEAPKVGEAGYSSAPPPQQPSPFGQGQSQYPGGPAYGDAPVSPNGPGGFYAGPSPAPPPRPPPRPSTSGSGSGTLFPTPSTGAFGFALSAVDRVAGRERREQLENLASSGTKLFKKITR
ncbi:hypothetical protein EYR40_004606 [Pleurotus pulmonarius]|nr:hypothetical protein EYR38_001837 [Pleurotus pulmonarius]KAF4605816.1 hypothetical protein EYR40_004606 [Pleurotus pulmonarius]